MPTEPLSGLIDRDFSRVSARPFIEVACPLLRELLHYSTHLLGRCASSATGGIDVAVAPLALYRQMMEVTDGIEVLLSEAAPNAAIPLLRTSYEAALALEYILSENTLYSDRSLAWTVWYARQRLALYERLDPETSSGQAFRKVWQRDHVTKQVSLPSQEEVFPAVDRMRRLLAKPHLVDIHRRLRDQKARSWYQLDHGPSNLESLADRLGRGGMYQILYRTWSATTHAQDLRDFLPRASGESGISGLRNLHRFSEVAKYSASFMLAATLMMMRRFRPDESSARWFVTEIRDRYRQIQNW